jgi:hypothetical protein
MPFLADEIRLFFIEPNKLNLRIIKTNHGGLLIDSNCNYLAIIYPDQTDRLCFEVFPEQDDQPELQRLMELNQTTYVDRRGIA